MIFFTKFHDDRRKIVDFLLIAIFLHGNFFSTHPLSAGLEENCRFFANIMILATAIFYCSYFQFFGMYTYQCNQKNIRVTIMNNLLPSNIKMHLKFDLKGSTFKRKVSLNLVFLEAITFLRSWLLFAVLGQKGHIRTGCEMAVM